MGKHSPPFVGTGSSDTDCSLSSRDGGQRAYLEQFGTSQVSSHLPPRGAGSGGTFLTQLSHCAAWAMLQAEHQAAWASPAAAFLSHVPGPAQSHPGPRSPSRAPGGSAPGRRCSEPHLGAAVRQDEGTQLTPPLQFKESALRKQSLYLKFDPLLKDSPERPAPAALAAPAALTTSRWAGLGEHRAELCPRLQEGVPQ